MIGLRARLKSEQVADHYEHLIKAGQIKPGDRLPAVSTIAAEWGIGRNTAHRAIADLQRQGLVTSSTQGTYAA